MKTAGYGGRTIRESVVVHTNDPRKPVMELMVSGKVEVFAEIRPRYLRLTGRTGESLTALVEITPRPDYPFKIRNIRAMNGQYILLSMDNKTQAGRPIYALTVTASRQSPGKISDVIHIETDSPIRPTLQVPVYGTIIEDRKEPS